MRVTTGGIIILLVLDFIVVGMLAWPLLVRLNALAQALPTDTGAAPSLTASLPASQTPTPETPTPLPSPTATLPPPYPGAPAVQAQGMVVLSLQDGLHSHLFAYQPQSLPLTRLTSGPWDDVSPCLSQDGKRLAFASNRNGYWDLYMLDIPSGELTRLTDSLDYKGAPSLSPDGLWMAYEAYTADPPGGLDIYIRQVSGGDTPIRLTDSPGADHSPVWSPLGRQIAFVSDRSGAPQIWLADLDKTGDQRFRNLSGDVLSQDSHPAWSPDGHSLAWSSIKNGYHSLMVRQVGVGDQPDQPSHAVGSGDWPAWSPDGRMLLASLLEPNQTYLVAYPLDAAGIVYPPISLPGAISGLAWSSSSLPSPLPAGFQQAAQVTPTSLYVPVISPVPGMPGGRQQVVTLKDVEAPYPMLNDLVDESFQALRAQTALSVGWDLLATLDNAYIPLTSSLDPGMEQDWLYTGRAFAFTPLPINAGWIVVNPRGLRAGYLLAGLPESALSRRLGRHALAQPALGFQRPLYRRPAFLRAGRRSGKGDPGRLLAGFHPDRRGVRLAALAGPAHLAQLLSGGAFQRICADRGHELGEGDAGDLPARGAHHSHPAGAAHAHADAHPTLVPVSHAHGHGYLPPDLDPGASHPVRDAYAYGDHHPHRDLNPAAGCDADPPPPRLPCPPRRLHRPALPAPHEAHSSRRERCMATPDGSPLEGQLSAEAQLGLPAGLPAAGCLPACPCSAHAACQPRRPAAGLRHASRLDHAAGRRKPGMPAPRLPRCLPRLRRLRCAFPCPPNARSRCRPGARPFTRPPGRWDPSTIFISPGLSPPTR